MRKKNYFPRKHFYFIEHRRWSIIEDTQHIPPFLISWHKNYSIAYMSTATNINSLTLEKDYLTLLTSTKDK